MVACFVDEDGTRRGESIIKRLSDFGTTGDMSEVGDMRYVLAEESSPGKSHVVAVWTEGPFNLYSFFPNNKKDTPGYDPPGGARPEQATRLLTVGAEGMPYGTWVYESRLTLHPMFEELDRDMEERGWKIGLGDGDRNRRRVYQRGGWDMIVSTVPYEDKTLVTMIRMGEDKVESEKVASEATVKAE